MKVTYFDGEAVWKALRELAPHLARQHPEVIKVAVFGSLVRNEAVPGSDIDLLLVLKESDRPFLDRPAKYRPGRFGVGVEVFAYTREELEQRLREGGHFLRRVLAEAVTLFEREGSQ